MSGDSASAGLVDDSDPEFEDFLAEHAQPAPDGGWIVEGDMHFISTDHLYEHFRANASPRDRSADASIRPRSTVYCLDDFDRVWNIGHRLAIPYCIGPFVDGQVQALVLAALPDAFLEAERASGLNYVELEYPTPEACEVAWENGDVRYIVREAKVCPEIEDPTEGDSKFELRLWRAYGTGLRLRGSGDCPLAPGHRRVAICGPHDPFHDRPEINDL